MGGLRRGSWRGAGKLRGTGARGGVIGFRAGVARGAAGFGTLRLGAGFSAGAFLAGAFLAGAFFGGLFFAGAFFWGLDRAAGLRRDLTLVFFFVDIDNLVFGQTGGRLRMDKPCRRFSSARARPTSRMRARTEGCRVQNRSNMRRVNRSSVQFLRAVTVAIAG